MNQIYFSKREAIEFGWNKMKTNFFFLLLVLLFVGLVGSVQEVMTRSLDQTVFLKITFAILFLILNALIQLGLITIALKIHDDQEPHFSDLFSNSNLIIDYLLASLKYFFIVFFGFLLFIIPGIIWSIKYSFYPYFIVDQGQKSGQALKSSTLITRNIKWQLFLLNLLFFLITLAGLLFFVIGLFAAVPITMIATAYVYRKLTSSIQEGESMQQIDPTQTQPASI